MRTITCFALSAILTCFLSGCAIRKLFFGSEGEAKIAIVPAVAQAHDFSHPKEVELDGSSNNDMEDIRTDFFHTHPAHKGAVNALVVLSDGSGAYSGGDDGKVVYSSISSWVFGQKRPNPGNIQRFAKTETLLEGSRPILALALSRDERYLAVTQFSTVVIVDLGTRTIVNKLTRVEGRITAVAWDPKGELVALGIASGDVFVWNLKRGAAAGKDSLDSVERYSGGDSPIVGIEFLPQARAFFAAERDGQIALWRLVRTELEMGLRDRFAADDQDQVGSEQTRFARLGGVRISDIWLNSQGSVLYAAGSDGILYSWKIRGLLALDKISAGKDAIHSLVGFSLGSPSVRSNQTSAAINSSLNPPINLIATTGREQRIKFWCQKNLNDKGDLTGPSILSTPVAETVLFTEPLMLIRSSRSSSLLWAAEKTGNLMSFDANVLLQSRQTAKRVRACGD